MYASLYGPQDASLEVSQVICIFFYSIHRRMSIHNSGCCCVVHSLASIRSQRVSDEQRASDPKRASDEWSVPILQIFHGSEVWGHFWWDLAALDHVKGISVVVHLVQTFSFRCGPFWRVKGRRSFLRIFQRATFTWTKVGALARWCLRYGAYFCQPKTFGTFYTLMRRSVNDG